MLLISKEMVYQWGSCQYTYLIIFNTDLCFLSQQSEQKESVD